ncbi:hypothetical protein C8R41DRAFT_231967 [Lentinula lateritia]|uniref:Uncharacterized protein n=1 Tax=Lentinula lateritia TaxID=40482 RepID=A0ABQ8VL99_9AGAR|nr:hypothetical protein C8R41DRAFT_231967 [Lentinula lateritia]
MSTAGGEKDLTRVLMRSTTPAPNDKVLKYLDGIATAQSEGEMETQDYQDELRSNHSGVSRHSRTAGSRSQNGALSPRSQNGQISHELVGLPLSYERLPPSDHRLHEMEEDVDDMASDVQQRSEGGMALPVPEPSPNDAPGPHYISMLLTHGLILPGHRIFQMGRFLGI